MVAPLLIVTSNPLRIAGTLLTMILIQSVIVVCTKVQLLAPSSATNLLNL